MTTLAVIGGSGFFGKSILEAYQRGLLLPWNVSNIIIISRNATRLKDKHHHLLDKSIKLINDDICISKSIPYADFVIHAAASTDAANYLKQPLQERKNIHAAVLNYSKLAKKFHQTSKIVYCSSGAVYGQQLQNTNGLSECAIFDSISSLPPSKQDYAAAKRDAELEIQKLGIEGLNVSVARCFAFVGPFLRRDQHFAIGNFIEDGIKGRPILVKAAHKVIRSYMFADDLVIWLMTLATFANSKCPIINVGSDESVDLACLATKIATIFDVPVQLPVFTVAEVDRYVPSIEKARNHMGLSLNFDLNASILATIKGI
jgi:dTDP-glucose 4,6-dehydratase